MNSKNEIRLEKLTDTQLALRMSKYIASIESIKVRAEYYSAGQCPEKELKEITRDYEKTRDSIREDCRYLNFNRSKQGSSLLWGKYFPSITEAAAWGMDADLSEGFTKAYFKSLDAAVERLTKYYSYDYWQIIAEL